MVDRKRQSSRVRSGGPLALAALAFALPACSPDAASPPSAKPLTPTQQAAALDRGRTIAAETFGVLSTNLQTALASGGVSNALPFCSLAASPLTASVAGRHGVTVRRFSHKPRNPAARASGVEVAMLDAFRAALLDRQAPTPVVTNLVGEQVTFFAPIVIQHALCLNCHGEPGRDIAPADLAVIRAHYPQDEATGFTLGDLRGAWRIEIPVTRLEGGQVR